MLPVFFNLIRVATPSLALTNIKPFLPLFVMANSSRESFSVRLPGTLIKNIVPTLAERITLASSSLALAGKNLIAP